MRYVLSIFILLFTLPAQARDFTLDPIYLRPDGAILSWTSDSVIDPYFPTKALLMANDNGMDISKIGNRWVEWLLARQDINGLFSRYCLKDPANRYDSANSYQPCASADADDAMMALWMELLYRLAPRNGLPDTWQESVKKAQYQLDSIFDIPHTVFVVSKTMPVGLLIDNVEIYAAYKRIEREAIRMGDGKTADDYRKRAAYLKLGIASTFVDQKTRYFKASTQDRKEYSFYPDLVAQVIPLLYDFHSSSTLSSHSFYKSWMKDHRGEWFGLIGKEYPWGLLAVLAVQQGDLMTANCWLQQAKPFRHSGQWNVLDEAAYQSIEWKLEQKWPHSVPACTQGGVS